ncbi:ATP-binding cassette domain-containing protein [Mucilaginibacter sp. RS28]|uniref:ATP-binding cassette domain-containing protein n=1 Tax=Mucilaginibacter straminoryzae TaxID=2932774 RepID=A0A9X1X2Q6_9SPHI|nr:ATP-binding cassette domain-containing protein [Mucilaginibacter straminoryzae]MCJ8210054.1 ATP-binding cassette domain-containing protein [Mucilaginibacter straminoryzae]
MIGIRIQKKLQLADQATELQVDINLPKGKITALSGKSGAGKTSLLKMIAGLMKPDEGLITSGDETWLDTSAGIDMPPQKRKLAFVFQDYALFPNMTVEGNLRYAAGKSVDEKLIRHLLEITQLSGFKKVKPLQLSGGQQQRLALARALAQQPDLLLMDEPLSALDLEARQQLQQELLLLHREFKFTAILVSHDISEISILASKVIQLANGRVAAFGTIEELFGSPDRNTLKLTGRVIGVEEQWLIVLVNQQVVRLKKQNQNYQLGESISVQINPDLLQY